MSALPCRPLFSDGRDSVGFNHGEPRGRQVEEAELHSRLEALTHEHRDLDSAIEALRGVAGHDQIQLARLKKRKLKLRDDIAWIHDQLVPDIIA